MKRVWLALGLLVATSAYGAGTKFKTSKETVQPGSAILVGGQKIPLQGGSMKVGQELSKVLGDFELGIAGKVAVISIVPSIDTPVCEEQTHVLGETTKLNKKVARVTVSRDPAATQAKFSKKAKLTNIMYVSDAKSGAFGKRSGLMIRGIDLLARAVLVVDDKGIIKHIQVVPDASMLPDMQTAFDVANKLAE